MVVTFQVKSGHRADIKTDREKRAAGPEALQRLPTLRRMEENLAGSGLSDLDREIFPASSPLNTYDFRDLHPLLHFWCPNPVFSRNSR